MQAQKQGDSYILVLEIGEELLGTITGFAKENNISGGSLQGIGALREYELGYYYLDKKEYGRKKFQDTAELISCLGNLAIKEGKPFAHLHVAMGQQDYTVIGGHLFSGIVAVTVEMVLFPFQQKIERAYDERTGLFLIDCKLL